MNQLVITRRKSIKFMCRKVSIQLKFMCRKVSIQLKFMCRKVSIQLKFMCRKVLEYVVFDILINWLSNLWRVLKPSKGYIYKLLS